MGDSLCCREGSPADCQEPGGHRRQEPGGERGLQELAPPPVSSGESPGIAGDTRPLESGLLPIKH